jgi:signal transduction histidine kinase
MLQNLVGNAIKFTPAHGQVRVSAEAVEGNGRVAITVSDTGPGIPRDVRDRLFEKFASGNQAGRGSGLGLHFCRLAAEAHGGRIWAGGEAGGARLTFTMPNAQAADA